MSKEKECDVDRRECEWTVDCVASVLRDKELHEDDVSDENEWEWETEGMKEEYKE